jgi:hypothetical protein
MNRPFLGYFVEFTLNPNRIFKESVPIAHDNEIAAEHRALAARRSADAFLFGLGTAASFVGFEASISHENLPATIITACSEIACTVAGAGKYFRAALNAASAHVFETPDAKVICDIRSGQTEQLDMPPGDLLP